MVNNKSYFVTSRPNKSSNWKLQMVYNKALFSTMFSHTLNLFSFLFCSLRSLRMRLVRCAQTLTNTFPLFLEPPFNFFSFLLHAYLHASNLFLRACWDLISVSEGQTFTTFDFDFRCFFPLPPSFLTSFLLLSTDWLFLPDLYFFLSYSSFKKL